MIYKISNFVKKPNYLIMIGKIYDLHLNNKFTKVEIFSEEIKFIKKIKYIWINKAVRSLIKYEKLINKNFKIDFKKSLNKQFFSSKLIFNLYHLENINYLNKYYIEINRNLFPVLNNNKFYCIDLLKCKVYNINKKNFFIFFGFIKNIFFNGFYYTLRLKKTFFYKYSYFKKYKKDILTSIPFNYLYIKKVNLKEFKIFIKVQQFNEI